MTSLDQYTQITIGVDTTAEPVADISRTFASLTRPVGERSISLFLDRDFQHRLVFADGRHAAEWLQASLKSVNETLGFMLNEDEESA